MIKESILKQFSKARAKFIKSLKILHLKIIIYGKIYKKQGG